MQSMRASYLVLRNVQDLDFSEGRIKLLHSVTELKVNQVRKSYDILLSTSLEAAFLLGIGVKVILLIL